METISAEIKTRSNIKFELEGSLYQLFSHPSMFGSGVEKLTLKDFDLFKNDPSTDHYAKDVCSNLIQNSFKAPALEIFKYFKVLERTEGC
jgi:hypothetical protein